MTKMNLFRKQYFVLITILFIGIECVYAGKIKIVNETPLKFHSIVIDYERNEGRHINKYIGGSSSLVIRSQPENGINKKDTIPYKSKIDLKEGICKLTFVAKNNICVVYALNTEKTKKLLLNEDNALIKSFPFGIRIGGGVQLYFNFVNSSDYTVYAIYPKISDRNFSFGDILYNTDERLLPKEQRQIFVEQFGEEEEYYLSVSIEFEIYAIDKDGKLKKGKVKETDLSVENINISNSDFFLNIKIPAVYKAY